MIPGLGCVWPWVLGNGAADAVLSTPLNQCGVMNVLWNRVAIVMGGRALVVEPNLRHLNLPTIPGKHLE
jgi:hypothetical protein